MPKPTSELANFIATRITKIQHFKSQKQVAQEAGFDSVNFVSMLKRGDAKLPIDRVSSFAAAVECDPRELMAITLRAHFGPRVAQEIVDLTGDTLTANERLLVEEMRRLNKGTDPKPEITPTKGIWVLFPGE